MRLEETKLGKPPVDRRGKRLYMKPSAIDEQTSSVEYGVPLIDTDPTYVMAANVVLPPGTNHIDYDRAFADAADVVEQYAKMGMFGGFFLCNDSYLGGKMQTTLTVWVTDFRD